MTGQITALVLSLCSHEPWCISEVGLLEPENTKEAILYYNAVDYRSRERHSIGREVADCVIKTKRDVETCRQEYYDRESRKEKARKRKPQTCAQVFGVPASECPPKELFQIKEGK